MWIALANGIVIPPAILHKEMAPDMMLPDTAMQDTEGASIFGVFGNLMIGFVEGAFTR